ncbi:unnamed protein product [Symbiodinium sp. CCMP2592]|nr:unnamed protein product [Symbiodinium sp. CCMP2592]
MLASSPACAFVVRSSKEQCCGSSAGPVNVQHIGGSWTMAASEEEAGTASSELLAWKELCQAGRERQSQSRGNSDDEETQEQSVTKARGASKTLLRLQTASTMINPTDGSSASSSSRSRSVSAAISEDRESSSSWFSRGCTPSICNSDDGRFAHHVVFRRAQTTSCEEALRAARATEAVRLDDTSKLSTGKFERKAGCSAPRAPQPGAAQVPN